MDEIREPDDAAATSPGTEAMQLAAGVLQDIIERAQAPCPAPAPPAGMISSPIDRLPCSLWPWRILTRGWSAAACAGLVSTVVMLPWMWLQPHGWLATVLPLSEGKVSVWTLSDAARKAPVGPVHAFDWPAGR
jgi:hypothetical protein